MMAEELKPCPFCGAAAVMTGCAPRMMQVACSNLDCPMDSSWRIVTEEEAIKAWKTRAQPTNH